MTPATGDTGFRALDRHGDRALKRANEQESDDMVATVRQCDPSTYRTFQSPEFFEPDWRSFYVESYKRTVDFSTTTRSEMGIQYGEDAFHTLDIFAPEDASDAPVLIFFHGGGFKEGHPSHYGYLGEEFLKRGAVFISAGYRFEPEHGYPDYVDDGAQVLKWAVDNVGRYGGSPDRIFASGHSAGANIVALLGFRTDWNEKYSLPADVVKGLALASGGYDFSIVDPAYPDQDVRPVQASIVHRIDTIPTSVVVGYGYPEAQRVGQSPDFFRNQGQALVDALAGHDFAPEVVEIPDTDHLRTGIALGDSASPFFTAVSRMIFT